MLNVADAGPPVSGNTEAEAVGEAVALTEGLGEPPSDGKGVKGAPVVLAIGYAQDRPSTSLYVRKSTCLGLCRMLHANFVEPPQEEARC
jgi:hypothetical protein